jgi:TonB family protein
MAKKVLLIEYEQRDRTRIRSLLDAPDFEVTETHDGEEGLAAFEADRFDAVLLSGKLPRLSPTDVIRDIRKKGGPAAPPIVLMTAGYSGSNTKADAQQIGAFEIVPKPFSDEALVGAVRSALDSTDRGAKTVQVPTASKTLTANDIFSDLLDELGREPIAAPEAAAPAPPPAPAPPIPRPVAAASARSSDTNEEVERRLRDTLSGVRMTPHAGTAPSSSPAKAAPARRSGEDEVDKLISRTLRIPIPKKVPAPPPPPAAAARPTPTASRRAEPAEAVAPSGPDRFGQYELLERIASGGMAELFRARRSGVEGFQKIVAIKKILPHIADNDEFITMFADEAKVAAQLNHPNIVHIYDLGKIEAGGYFIAMEYVEGMDLRAILRSGSEVGLPMPVPLAVYVASKVASALDYAHRRRDARGEELRIVHRDVSPQNILISHEGEIKLCDFGIAKADRKVSQTESGSLKGKLQYMSPEQAWGKPIDHRSDLFSLGTVLHEMLTGQRLFRGDSDLTVLELVRKADVRPPSAVNADVSAPLDAIVAKALAREPEDRYGTGSEMLRDLESILYAYTPAPGSADLAIYVNHLREASAAAPAARPVPEPARPSRPAFPVVPAAREAATVPIAAAEPVPAPGIETAAVVAAESAPAERSAEVFGSFSQARVDSEKKGRMPLYAGIAAAVVVGLLLALFLTRRTAPESPAAAPAPVAAPTVAPIADAAPVVTPGVDSAASLDPKAIEQEVQRQLAEKRAAMLKSGAVAAVPSPRRNRPTAVVEAEAPTQEPIARVEPTSPPPFPTFAAPEPTEVAVAAPPPAAPAPTEVVASRESPPAPAREAPAAEEVSRGDLVGPGPGVVEPVLLAPPRVVYSPLARQQRISGRVVVLVLVTEEGLVSQARIQSGIGGRSGIDGSVLEGVRSARFRPATKNGTPVRMWRTVVVDVRL